MKHTQNENAVSPVIGVIKDASHKLVRNFFDGTYGWNYRNPCGDYRRLCLRNGREHEQPDE